MTACCPWMAQISELKRTENDFTLTSSRVPGFDMKFEYPFYMVTLFGSMGLFYSVTGQTLISFVFQWLGENERVEADDDYRRETPSHAKPPRSITFDEDLEPMRARVRSRHETVNKRFKHFGCMNKRFRHNLNKHSACFRAVAVITQIAFELGEPLFDVEYDDGI
jgi:hypothetical protein